MAGDPKGDLPNPRRYPEAYLLATLATLSLFVGRAIHSTSGGIYFGWVGLGLFLAAAFAYWIRWSPRFRGGAQGLSMFRRMVDRHHAKRVQGTRRSRRPKRRRHR